MSESLFLPHCFKAGVCRLPTGEVMSQCPTRTTEKRRYLSTSPLIPAEALCLDALRASPISRNHDAYKENFNELCYDLEHAMALPMGLEEVYEAKIEMFHAVLKRFKSLREQEDICSKSRLGYALKLRQIGAFMPIFRARIFGESGNENAVYATHRNICHLLQDFDRNFIYPIPKTELHARKDAVSKRSELEVAGLLTRTGHAVCLAMPREESSQARPEFNHDLLELTPDGVIPIQCKRSKRGSGYRNVVIIQLYDIMRAMRTERVNHTQSWQPNQADEDFEWPSPYVYTQIIEGTRPDPISQLLVEETLGINPLPRVSHNALNLATSYVTARTSEYARTYLA